jgi:hypothetical protein
MTTRKQAVCNICGARVKQRGLGPHKYMKHGEGHARVVNHSFRLVRKNKKAKAVAPRPPLDNAFLAAASQIPPEEHLRRQEERRHDDTVHQQGFIRGLERAIELFAGHGR